MSSTARKSTPRNQPADDEVVVVRVNPPPVIDLTSSDDDSSDDDSDDDVDESSTESTTEPTTEPSSDPSSEPSSESRGKKQTKWVQCFTISLINSFVSLFNLI